MHVLIVDDDPVSRRLARAVLESEGFTIHEAGDGIEALAMLERKKIDGIVSDIMMPRMDGYRFCHEVRMGRRFREMPFVFYSASYTSPEDEKLALDLGADELINKTESPSTVSAALRKAAGAPRRQPGPVKPPQELNLMKEYNERLVAKLEEKNAALGAQTVELQESEGRLRAIITTEPECVKVVSPEGRLLEMNPAGLAMLEAGSLAEAQQQPLLEFIVPEHRAAFGELHKRVMRGESGMLEFEVTGLKGKHRWLETHAVPLRDSAGQVQSLLGVTRDVTERRRAGSALKESESYKRAILESALDCIIAMNHEGNMVEFNPAAEKTFGYARAEAVGREMAALIIPAGMREQHRRGLARLLKGGASKVLGQRLELTAMRKDGTEFPVELTITRMRDLEPPMFTGFIRDLSERKRAEEARLSAESRFRQLVEQSLVGIYIVQDGRFAYVNPKMTDIFGVPGEELTARPIQEFVFPQDRDLVRENLRQRLEGLVKSIRYEVRIVHRSGAVRHVEVHGSLTEHNGRAAVTGMMLDITERKGMELRAAALANLGQQLSAAKTAREAGEVIVSIADQLFGWDGCKLDLYFPETDRLRRVLNQDIVNGRRADCPLPYEDRDTTPRARRIIERGAELILREAPYVMAPDSVPFGDTARASASIMEVPIRDGLRVIGILSIQSYQAKAYRPQDLEALQSLADHCGGALERIRGREALDQSEQRFRQLAENINEVFWMTDVTKNQMLYVSPAYEAIWGRTCESLYRAPTTWLEAIHPDDRAQVREAATTKQARGEYDEVYRILRPDGSVRWIRDRAFPIRNPAGEVYRVVGTAEDITQQRMLEQQLRQSQKMEAIGTLAGGIAHDFNNILAAINGYTDLAKMDPESNPAIREYLDEITRAGWRAADLVQQILTFSRQQEQQRKRLHLRHVVGEAFKLLRATIPATIRFNLSLATDAPMVLADATQVHQIVMNLGTNAAHAMRDRPGRLEVKLEAFAVDTGFAASHRDLHPGRYARLSISDSGHGMDRATLERIFEPFFTTKAPGEGTGLGLSVVHGIMQAHEGCITVYSEPGKGTTFNLYFPGLVDTEAETPAAEKEIPRGRGERILFVDDEAPLVRLGQMMLERLGYTVEIRNNPSEVLTLVRAQPDAFDLVLTDLTMPGMTGTELAKHLLKIRADLPIILTTGYAANLTSETVKAAGISALLLKPLSRQSLGETIHRVLHPGKEE